MVVCIRRNVFLKKTGGSRRTLESFQGELEDILRHWNCCLLCLFGWIKSLFQKLVNKWSIFNSWSTNNNKLTGEWYVSDYSNELETIHSDKIEKKNKQFVCFISDLKWVQRKTRTFPSINLLWAMKHSTPTFFRTQKKHMIEWKLITANEDKVAWGKDRISERCLNVHKIPAPPPIPNLLNCSFQSNVHRWRDRRYMESVIFTPLRENVDRYLPEHLKWFRLLTLIYWSNIIS